MYNDIIKSSIGIICIEKLSNNKIKYKNILIYLISLILYYILNIENIII